MFSTSLEMVCLLVSVSIATILCALVSKYFFCLKIYYQITIKKTNTSKKNCRFLNHLNFAIKTITRWMFPGDWNRKICDQFQNGKCVWICALCSTEYLSDVGFHFFFSSFSFNFFRTTKHIHCILECIWWWETVWKKKLLRKITRNSFDGWKNPRKSVKQKYFFFS